MRTSVASTNSPSAIPAGVQATPLRVMSPQATFVDRPQPSSLGEDVRNLLPADPWIFTQRRVPQSMGPRPYLSVVSSSVLACSAVTIPWTTSAQGSGA